MKKSVGIFLVLILFSLSLQFVSAGILCDLFGINCGRNLRGELGSSNPIAVEGSCKDGIDNDNDGKIDWPNDRGCLDANDNNEFGEPMGYLDGIQDCKNIYGWSCDPDDFNAVGDVHLYIDGPVGAGGKFLGIAKTDVKRESAVGALCGGNSNHGYSFPIPESYLDGNKHVVYAYAINLGTPSNNAELSGNPKEFSCSDCKKVCKNIGTKSEGFYNSCTGELIEYAQCGSEVKCTDSDGGGIKEEYIKGEVSIINFSGTYKFSDYCSSNDTLKEYSCSNNRLFSENVGCPGDYKCKDGACGFDQSCKNECSNGQRICSGNGFKICGDHDGDNCLEWGGGTNNCGEGRICSNGICLDKITNSTCTDSDGGKNIYKSGKAYDNDRGQYDYCDFISFENGILKEAVCNVNGKKEVIDVKCPAETPYCNRGICSNIPAKCEDTDGGNNIFIKGITTIPTSEDAPQHTDYCEYLSTKNPANYDSISKENYCEGSDCGLREFSCFLGGPNLDYKVHKCPNGCKNGACRINELVEVKEQVKCVFNNSLIEQKCYTAGNNSISCNGVGSCVVNVIGKKGEKLTWKSSCGGDVSTLIDGINKYVKFDCNNTNEMKCTDSDGGKNEFVKGTVRIGKVVIDDICSDKLTGASKDNCDGEHCYVNEFFCVGDNDYTFKQIFCPNGCKNGACIEKLDEIKEQVKCVFKNSSIEQKCYTAENNLVSCKGVGSCIVNITGKKGEKLTWKSSCGGYVSTLIDGIDEYVEFNCNNTNEIKCTDSDGGINYYKKGHLVHPEQNADYFDTCTDLQTLDTSKGWTPTEKGKILMEYYCGGDDVGYSYQYHSFNCSYGCKDGACVEKISEKITCKFENTKEEQQCYLGGGSIVPEDEGIKFCKINAGTDLCDIEYLGYKGEKLTWKSTCGGYQYTFQDGIDETIYFKCEDKKKLVCENSCLSDNKCYPLGYRKNGEYCSDVNKFVKQLISDKPCENNFECSSNLCISGKCVSPSLIEKIFNWFRKLFRM